MKTANKPKKLKPEKNPAGMKLLRTLHGHADLVYGIAFSPDGKKIASCSGDKTIKIWETDSGKKVFTLKGHEGQISCIAFSPDGKKMVSGSHDETIKIWETDSGKNMATFASHKSRVYSVSFSPDSKKIISGGDDKSIKIWDADSGKNIATLVGHTDSVLSASISLDGKKIVSGSGAKDKSIKIWATGSGKNIATLKGHREAIISVSFSSDGKKIASASHDATIRIWDVRTKKMLQVLEGHTAKVSSCVFTPDGQILASKSDDNTVWLWRTDFWQTIAIVDEPDIGYWAPEMAFHPSKPILAAHGKKNSVIKLWELDYNILLGKDFISDSVPYTTAKIALVGDSGVGKTGLGWRLAHGSFKEHSSTHGQQFWVIDELGKKRSDGAECEAVLWDLAGQQDYRLVHALFLKDVDLALVLFDPGNREKTVERRGILAETTEQRTERDFTNLAHWRPY